jgi:RING-type zinc-finger
MMGGYAECPICMDTMTEADNMYPMLCPTKCGYNFCANCVTHLLDSSKDDYQEASDGNRHVKIRLQCPQCRGVFKDTIQDSLLLRKAKASEKFRNIPDSELKSSELRIKHEFLQFYAKDVEHAEARLRKYQIDRGEEVMEKLDLTMPSASFDALEPVMIDTTLFQGLEFAMSSAEQEFVTVLLVSGNAEKLAQAAQILHGIFQLSLAGVTPSLKGTSPKQAWSDERKHLERLAKYRLLHPLPARMPKYFFLNVWSSNNSKSLSFDDDEWDGSIADAFSRANISKVTPGMANILSQTDETKISVEPKPRVKISAVRGPAGRLGVQKGDVVTHLDGEPWQGSAADLKQHIYRLHDQDPTHQIQMVVNAEESCAEILKLRAKACQKILKELNDL